MVPLRLVLIEDELIIAEDLRRTLVRLGYVVEAMFASGERAIAEIPRIRPNLVLLDIRLAGKMDGIETARQLRSQCEVSIVFLTAHSDEATLFRALEVGDGFVFKPFEEQALVSAIEEVVRKKPANKSPVGAG